MSPLNDEELNSLLQQLRNALPEASPGLPSRALHAYEADMARTTGWRRLLLRHVVIPWPLGLAAAVFLLLVGAAADRALRRPSVVEEARVVEIPVTTEYVVYRDCPAGQPQPSIATLTLKDFQPVRQITPRIVRSIRDDQ
jgi:hypothetical protein